MVRRDRGEKVIAFKYRPKARRRVKKGHRQELTVLRIADIRFGGKSAAEPRARRSSAKTERQRLEEAAAPQAAEDAALAAKLAVGRSRPSPRRSREDDQGEAAKADRQGRTKASREGPAKAETPRRRRSRRPRPRRSRRRQGGGEGLGLEARRAREVAKAADAKADDATPDAAPKRSRTKKDE